MEPFPDPHAGRLMHGRSSPITSDSPEMRLFDRGETLSRDLGVNLTKIIEVFFVLPFFCIPACTSFGSSDVVGMPDKDDSDRAIILFESIDDVVLHSDPAEIRDVAVSGDILTLKVTYGGGCERHDFALYGWRGYNKSNPPQALLFLSHNAHGDRCEALIMETLHFSLSPLRVRVFRNRSPVYLRIHDPGSDDPIMPMPVYSFQ